MMIPAGYMAKRVVSRPDWLKAKGVEDIYSVSSCISKDFADYIKFWKHNSYWFFDSPEVIEQVAREQSIDLTGTTMFYYEVYEEEFDEKMETGARLNGRSLSEPTYGCQAESPFKDTMLQPFLFTPARNVRLFRVIHSPLKFKRTCIVCLPILI